MAADDDALAAMGYAPELKRSMGAFHNFALSFSIISILTGAVTLYGAGLTSGGPFAMLAGWPLVALFTMAIACSLAELASAFPTAGALYHWASMLGGTGAGWATAWLNLIGQFAITAAIDFGLAAFLAPLLGLPDERSSVLVLCALVLLSHAILNHVGVKVVAALNTVSAWYHVIGVAVLVGVLAIFAPLQPVTFLLDTTASKVHPFLPGFLVALLQAGWTFTGYDASAHASEETHDAATNAPRGIVMAVAASAVAGWAMLIVVTLAIRSLPAVNSAKQPFIAALEGALGRGGTVLVWVCVGAMWFCGLASVTSNSRMLYAFARDGGLPFSRQLAKVSSRWQTPHIAVWVSVVMAMLLSLVARAEAAIAALSTVALYSSYGLPILFGWWRRWHGGWGRSGPWTLGRWSSVVNVIAVLWIVFMVVLMSLADELAGMTSGIVVLVLLVAWFGGVRKRFHGPPHLRGSGTV